MLSNLSLDPYSNSGALPLFSMEAILNLQNGPEFNTLSLQNLNAKHYGCPVSKNTRFLQTAFLNTGLAMMIGDQETLYMNVNGQMRKLDDASRQGLFKYSEFVNGHKLVKDLTSSTTVNDIALLECG